MSRTEIVSRLDELASIEWDMNMKDHWTQADWELDAKLENERWKLAAMLKEIDGTH